MRSPCCSNVRPRVVLGIAKFSSHMSGKAKSQSQPLAAYSPAVSYATCGVAGTGLLDPGLLNARLRIDQVFTCYDVLRWTLPDLVQTKGT